MLPEITKKQAVDKFYWDKLMNQFLDKKLPNDGHTNVNGKKLLFEIKDYLEKSYIYLIAIHGFLDSFEKMEVIWNIDPLFASYKSEYVYKKTNRNIRRMLYSLMRQRRYYRMVKSVVIKNEVDSNWNYVLKELLKQANERLETIERLIKENLICTPFIVYVYYLDSKGLTLIDDISEIAKSDYGAVFSEEYTTFEDAVLGHICDVFKECESSKDIIEAAVKHAEEYSQAEARRLAIRKAEQEKTEKEDNVEREKEADDMLAMASGNSNRYFIGDYAYGKALARIYTDAGRKPFYIIAGVDISRNKDYGCLKLMYINRYRNMSTLTSKAKNAARFESEEEAKKGMEKFAKKRPSVMMDILKIDLGPIVAAHQTAYAM